ncbi:MAG: DUF5011 domain-containing protein [Lachnospiraceae bacterium]|nr:DUF5011 domain-containing protein [Lachnospiraceae bacterium]
MRYIRIAAVVIFILSFALNAGAYAWDKVTEDTTPPEITCEEDTLQVRVDCEEEELLEGLKARDDRDGDLTDQIIVAEMSHFIEKGVCSVKYVVFDSDHNWSEYTRTIEYTDYESPRFSMTQPQVYVQGEDIRFLDSIKASDVLEGDISNKIRVVSSDVDNYTPGTYPVQLEVTNSLGDTTSLDMNVTILDHEVSGPEIILTKYLEYVNKGGSFDPEKYISEVIDLYGEELEDPEVTISGKVNTKKPGTYQVVYKVSDENTETQGQTCLTVVVTE